MQKTQLFIYNPKFIPEKEELLLSVVCGHVYSTSPTTRGLEKINDAKLLKDTGQ